MSIKMSEYVYIYKYIYEYLLSPQHNHQPRDLRSPLDKLQNTLFSGTIIHIPISGKAPFEKETPMVPKVMP